MNALSVTKGESNHKAQSPALAFVHFTTIKQKNGSNKAAVWAGGKWLQGTLALVGYGDCVLLRLYQKILMHIRSTLRGHLKEEIQMSLENFHCSRS